MRYLITAIAIICTAGQLDAQDSPSAVLKGIVCDIETGAPLAGANLYVLNSDPPTGTTCDNEGHFLLRTYIGRVSLRVSFIGYEDVVISDILTGSGKETYIAVKMREALIRTGDVVVRPGSSSAHSVNTMASVSTNTIRTDDALRYAGGFYDPSRIVNSFAGVLTSNSDHSNDIVIRGNSSRGLLWRL